MKTALNSMAFIAVGVLLTACETTTALPYQASTQNVITAQHVTQASNSKVTLGSFVAAPGAKKPTCRMMGEVDVAPGKSIEIYVRDAFQQELFMAGAYDQASPVTITGRIDDIDVNTVGTGTWKISLSVSSTADPAGYSVSTTYPFASSFSAVGACKNAAASFNPTVQELLGKVVSNPGFKKLVGGH